ncbi:VWA domain-containing protein [soil metagenome]
MGFIYPEMLWLLAVLLPLAALWSFASRTRDGALARFVVRENWPLLSNSLSTGARFHKALLVMLALVLSVIAAARPYWGVQEREVKFRGVNMILAIDVSDSMRARDVGAAMGGGSGEIPNRLSYARSLARQVLLECPGNRVGLMPFAGEAFLQCPITTDYGMAQFMAKTIDFGAVAAVGSDLRDVVQKSADAFESAGDGSRILILITDGEDHSEAIVEAGKLAAEKHIRIFSLGVGSADGAPIPMPDNTYKETKQGTKVVSKLDAASLKELADATNGRAYIPAGGGRVSPDPLIDDLKNMDRSDLATEKRTIREERYQWPLALALLCLAIEALITERKRVRRTAVIAATPAKISPTSEPLEGGTPS